MTEGNISHIRQKLTACSRPTESTMTDLLTSRKTCHFNPTILFIGYIKLILNIIEDEFYIRNRLLRKLTRLYFLRIMFIFFFFFISVSRIFCLLMACGIDRRENLTRTTPTLHSPTNPLVSIVCLLRWVG